MITIETLKEGRRQSEKEIYGANAKKCDEFVTNNHLIEYFDKIGTYINYKNYNCFGFFGKIVKEIIGNKLNYNFIKIEDYRIDDALIDVNYLRYFYKKYKKITIQDRIILNINCVAIFDSNQDFIGLILKKI